MKTSKTFTIGIFSFFLFFGAVAQNEGQQQQDQSPNMEQDEGRMQQDQADPDRQHQSQQDDMMHDQDQDIEQTQEEMDQQDQQVQDQLRDGEQDLDQGERRTMQNQFQEFNDPQTYSGSDLEEAILSAGNTREWDRSGDGKFDAAEFFVVLFHIWDRNHDGVIDQDEWEYGSNNFLSEYNQEEFGDFREWDEDGNNELDVNEFARSIERAELYNASPGVQADERAQRTDGEGEVETEQDRETTAQQDDTEFEQDTQGQQQQAVGEYQEPGEAIVIWERRGVVEKIEIGDRTITLGKADRDESYDDE